MASNTDTIEEIKERAQIAANTQRKTQYLIRVKFAASGWGFTSKPSQLFDYSAAVAISPASNSSE